MLLWDVARLLRKGQRPVVVLTPQQLQGAWDRLGGTEYGSDPRASNLLIAGTDQTVPWLREKLQPAREAAAGSAADAKRSLEAVEVLAAIGTPKARRLLAKLAAGAPRAELTRKAKTALAKMAEDPSVP